MRSEATMSRRSPRSYISRTFPDARRGRSETGGMGRRLLGLEDDDGDDAVGLALVVRVARRVLVGAALGGADHEPLAVRTGEDEGGVRIGARLYGFSPGEAWSTASRCATPGRSSSSHGRPSGRWRSWP